MFDDPDDPDDPTADPDPPQEPPPPPPPDNVDPPDQMDLLSAISEALQQLDTLNNAARLPDDIQATGGISDNWEKPEDEPDQPAVPLQQRATGAGQQGSPLVRCWQPGTTMPSQNEKPLFGVGVVDLSGTDITRIARVCDVVVSTGDNYVRIEGEGVKCWDDATQIKDGFDKLGSLAHLAEGAIEGIREGVIGIAVDAAKDLFIEHEPGSDSLIIHFEPRCGDNIPQPMPEMNFPYIHDSQPKYQSDSKTL